MCGILREAGMPVAEMARKENAYNLNFLSIIHLHDKVVWVVSPLWRLTSLPPAAKK
jgi:hypothetical protein